MEVMLNKELEKENRKATLEKVGIQKFWRNPKLFNTNLFKRRAERTTHYTFAKDGREWVGRRC